MDDLIRRSDAIRIASGYCHWSNIPDELAKLPSVNPTQCGDAISRQALKDLGAECIAKRDENGNLIPLGSIDSLPSVSTEKTDAYKQGWHDAICKALDEAYDIVIDGERFSVVQEETLIGVGMAYEQVSTEKTGRWKRRIVDSGYNADWSCSCCGYKVKTDFVNFKYCPNCGARMEVEDG